ncbi:hypothetical protein C8Q75DRAFT_737486 [Abortiporus biennis]|nr:hypothetical protein C8Q75DRAFT_737486 [Abortiporus biennis]
MYDWTIQASGEGVRHPSCLSAGKHPNRGALTFYCWFKQRRYRRSATVLSTAGCRRKADIPTSHFTFVSDLLQMFSDSLVVSGNGRTDFFLVATETVRFLAIRVVIDTNMRFRLTVAPEVAVKIHPLSTWPCRAKQVRRMEKMPSPTRRNLTPTSIVAYWSGAG